MRSRIKLTLINLIINIIFFIFLIISIQNNQKRKVDLFFWETVLLPISFISGTSFISGSIAGLMVSSSLNLETKE